MNGESFLVLGEMTIAANEEPENGTPDDVITSLPSSTTTSTTTSTPHTTPPNSAPVPRQNPLLAPRYRQLSARVIEDHAEIEVTSSRQSSVISRRKSFGKTPKQQVPSPHSVIDLTEPSPGLTNKPRCSEILKTVYSPSTYSNARAKLQEPDPPVQTYTQARLQPQARPDPPAPLQPRPDPPLQVRQEPSLQVRPSCHYYGTKRLQNQSPAKQAQPRSHNLFAAPVTKQTKPQSLPATKHPPIFNIEPDSNPVNKTKQQKVPKTTPHKGTKSPDAVSPVPSKSNLSLDDDVFEYTPAATSAVSNEKFIKNEDRYSKYELAKMANDR